jgi:hypothetical protein
VLTQQERRIAQQNSQLQMQDNQLQSLQADYSELQTGMNTPRSRMLGISPTGTGSSFMNYSHYFPARR